MTFEELIIKWNKGKSHGAKLAFAKKMHILHTTLSQWINGRNLPNEKLRPKIAKELGVSLDALMQIFAHKKQVKNKIENLEYIPVLGYVNQSSNIVLKETPSDDFLPIEVKKGKNFAFKILGTNLEPNFNLGDYLIFVYATNISDGSLGIIEDKNQNTYIFGKISYVTEEGIKIDPITNETSKVFLRSTLYQIIGSLVGVFRKVQT